MRLFGSGSSRLGIFLNSAGEVISGLEVFKKMPRREKGFKPKPKK
jgi:hypothetical protein